MNDEVRVLYLLTSPISSGFLRGQLSFLGDRGYSVFVGVGSEDAPGGARFDNGVVVEQLPFVRSPRPFNDAWALVETVRLIRKVRPRLVNASTPKAGLLGMVAAWLCRVPVRVYVVRGLRFETMSGRARQVYRALEWTAARCATHVLFNSTSLRHAAEAAGIVRVGKGDVLGDGSGNGVAVERFDGAPDRAEARRSLGLDGDDAVIGFVGRLSRDKGIADLVRAFGALCEKVPAARLLLVGTPEDGDPLDAATRESIQRDDRITCVPWLDNPAAAYRAMDVLAFPSYREGMPNVPLEAQLCGVPVVGYSATGTVDAIRDGVTGALVPTGDAASLTDALVRLLADPELRRSMGDEGASWVRATFSQERIWTALAARYERWLAEA